MSSTQRSLAHKSGTSSLLADSFINGAEENGHEIFRFDSAFKDVRSDGKDGLSMGLY